MPIVTSKYHPPFWSKNGTVATVFSGLYRKVDGVIQKRERIATRDHDFLDLDWSYTNQPTKSVVILLHGLEGHGQRPYITGSAKLFNANGIDACAVNFRGCSGEDNKYFYSYHSGATDDLDDVIQHCIQVKKYEQIFIKGISLGGNITLKYCGEKRELPEEIKAVIAVSVPIDLSTSAAMLHKFRNKPYAINFLNHLKEKLHRKINNFPNQIDLKTIKKIKTLYDFDEVYTSKAHGFINAQDYYQKCSSRQFISSIKTPTLLLNALNDTFLSAECFPIQEAKRNRNFFLEIPKEGGHVGFILKNNIYYNELRALEFIKSIKF